MKQYAICSIFITSTGCNAQSLLCAAAWGHFYAYEKVMKISTCQVYDVIYVHILLGIVGYYYKKVT